MPAPPGSSPTQSPREFTQGLIYRDGFLYESTGRAGRSTLRKVRLETGEIVQQRAVDEQYSAEGLADWRGTLVQLAPMRGSPTIPSAIKSGERASVVAAIERRLGMNVGLTYDLASRAPRGGGSRRGPPDRWPCGSPPSAGSARPMPS